jgi:DNA primase
MRTNEDGEIVMHYRKEKSKSFSKGSVFSMQEDEVANLQNPLFKDILNDLINYYLQNEAFSLEQYLMHL